MNYLNKKPQNEDISIWFDLIGNIFQTFIEQVWFESI